MDSKTTQENLKSDKTEKSEKNQDTTQDRSQQRAYILKNISDAWYVANLWITANEKILLVLLNGLAILVAIGLWVSTQKQIKTAEDIAHKQLRAYVGIAEVTYGESGLMFGRTFFIKNSGQTPAYEVQARAEVRILRNEEMKTIEDPRY